MLDMSGREVLNSEEEECEKLMCGALALGVWTSGLVGI